jgi:uncharacterized protein (TIGR02646 family)
VNRLYETVKRISESQDQKSEADRLYTLARQAAWFEPVTQALNSMAGPGERCMFCSGSESSCVEHFQPKAVFPLMAMVWENYLWSCDICNRSKGERFPPKTEPGEQLIDPTVEDVWSFFFIDEYGNLTARWRPDLNDVDGRASITIDFLSLDRDALQESRQLRLRDLKEKAKDSLDLVATGKLTKEELRMRIESWKSQPFQPDVTDYFLNGPGKAESPFAELRAEAGL